MLTLRQASRACLVHALITLGVWAWVWSIDRPELMVDPNRLEAVLLLALTVVLPLSGLVLWGYTAWLALWSVVGRPSGSAGGGDASV